LSLAVFTHSPSQPTVGDGQVPMQPFETQNSFAPHVLPHWPQLSWSTPGVTHSPLQSIWLKPQSQLPPLHSAPASHWFPHEPQLASLDAVSTQMPPQAV
jgi:hypothetical protein